MSFVNEQNNGVRAALDLVDHILESVLKLALHRCARLQQAHVQHVNFHPLQWSGHLTQRHTQSQPFDHRRFTHASLAGQDRVVLTAAHQNINGLANLGIAPNHRVHLSIARTLRQVGRELIQRRGFATQSRTRLAIRLQIVGHRRLRITHHLCRLH